MEAPDRKKSPRAPSIPLDEAIDRVGRMYKQDRLNAAPADVAAQHLGYKSAKNGAALQTLASLRYYGLVDRPKDGSVAVSRDFEYFQHAPDEATRRKILLSWLRKPPVFAELLDQYASGLPSESLLKFGLIQRGFSPAAADTCISVFVRSVEMSRYYDQTEMSQENVVVERHEDAATNQEDLVDQTEQVESAHGKIPQSPPALTNNAAMPGNEMPQSGEFDRIPIRLAQNRKAWLVVPTPFFVTDKARIKAQVDLLLADDEEQ